ncbi:MAG TPA: sulfate adenylyltransferase, partial [Bacteroidia bacterium]|nr:sulfate adenylyltransferase [Bacteroidia bacterium]
PSGFTSRISKIDSFDGEIMEGFAPMSVTMLLEDALDISRGDMIVRENNSPQVGQDIDLMICWLNDKKMEQGNRYVLRHTTREVRCMVKDVRYKIDINTLRRIEDDAIFGMNDIGRIQLRTTSPLFFDSYRRNRNTGSVILVDESTNETVGAGMIL